MEEWSPKIFILAGPNGSGKSTAAAHLLPERITFVNADEVAKTLPGYPSISVDIQAGRLVLERMDDLETKRISFALETTLSSRSLVPRIVRLRSFGYQFRLLFLYIPTADLAVGRVAARVLRGGHSIPEETIRRRYTAGIRNLFELYRPLADKWSAYDSTLIGPPRLLAEGKMNQEERVYDPGLWETLRERGSRGR
jgi:predicted ABC-type ATPase